ncbi:MAG: hypothetical protein ACLQU5_12500 [Isosphaeraceae bacterium]
MGSRKIWTVVVMLFGSYTAYAPRSGAQWGGFSFDPPSINISPPKIGGELGKIGGQISSGAKHAGGVVSGGAKHAGGVVSGGAKHAAGVVSDGAKHAGGVVSGGAKHAGGVVSGGAKHAGGVVSGGAKHAEGYGSSIGKHAVGIAKQHPGQVVLGALYPYYPAFHYAANWKPFPNATLGNQNLTYDLGGHRYKIGGKGELFGHYYELGIRNQTASDLGIDATDFYTSHVAVPSGQNNMTNLGTSVEKQMFKAIYGPNPPTSWPVSPSPGPSGQGPIGQVAIQPNPPTYQANTGSGQVSSPVVSPPPSQVRPGTVAIQPYTSTPSPRPTQAGRAGGSPYPPVNNQARVRTRR